MNLLKIKNVTNWQKICELWPNFIGYINNNSFPQPLNQEEEKYYMNAFSSGDMEARNVLIERNLRLVAHVAKKFESTGIEKDDLISIGTIGLVKAINSYSLEKGSRLATYSARCIENVILTQWLEIFKTTKNCPKINKIQQNGRYFAKLQARCMYCIGCIT